MNRRSFIGALGVFAILPGAGRVWRAVREPEYRCILIGPMPRTTLTSLSRHSLYDFLLERHGPFEPAKPSDIPMCRLTPSEMRKLYGV
jgi:hypothetical protein